MESFLRDWNSQQVLIYTLKKVLLPRIKLNHKFQIWYMHCISFLKQLVPSRSWRYLWLILQLWPCPKIHWWWQRVYICVKYWQLRSHCRCKYPLTLLRVCRSVTTHSNREYFPPPPPQFFVANFKTRLLGDKLKSVLKKVHTFPTPFCLNQKEPWCYV